MVLWLLVLLGSLVFAMQIPLMVTLDTNETQMHPQVGAMDADVMPNWS